MAFIPLSNGGALPVFATDVLNGPLDQATPTVGTGPAGSQYPQKFNGGASQAPLPTVNLAGPKYDFFKIAFTNDISLSAGVGEGLQLLIQTLQNGGDLGGGAALCGGTVAMYSAWSSTPLATGGASVVSVAIYPTGVFNTAVNGTDNSGTNLVALIAALGTPTFQDGTTFDFTTAAVTEPGFVLA